MQVYVPTAADVGCYIYVMYTPVRSDGVVGRTEQAMTAQKIEGNPSVKLQLIQKQQNLTWKICVSLEKAPREAS